VVNKLISGWSANGIVMFQSGYPVPLREQNNNLSNLFDAGTIRPDYVPGCVKKIEGSAQSRISQWFNTACLTRPGAYSFGNEARNDPDLRTHGVNNFDFTMSKRTTITEQVSLQFRAEFFNLFNRTQFVVYNNRLGDSTFGTITFARNYPRLIQFALRLVF
jgi:hypothetical protein